MFTYYVIIVFVFGTFAVIHTVSFGHLVNLCLGTSQSDQLRRKFWIERRYLDILVKRIPSRACFSVLYITCFDIEEENSNTFNISGNGFFVVPLRINSDEERGQIRQRWNSICDINNYYFC